MNPETLAIARENLISRGIPNPHPDDVAKEALRLHEANKQYRTPKITPRVLALLLAVSIPTKEQALDIGRQIDRILDTRIL